MYTIRVMKAWLIFVSVLLVSAAAVFGLGGIATSTGIGSLAMADPLYLCVLFALALALASFVASLLTADHSWVDRLWSTAPIIMVWIYSFRSGFSLPLVLASLLVTIWGVRLTLNFARKGGYTGVEDYRWAILKSRMPNTLAWQIFNLVFICGIQIALFVLFTLPAWSVFLTLGATVTPLALGAAFLMIASMVFETLADAQQWDFHQSKQAYRLGKAVPEHHAEDVKRGFLSGGLFAYSRHPNYFGELMVWWSFYLFGAAVSGSLLIPGLAGPVLLTLLFIGSTRFTEELSAAKYPAYLEYQKMTSPVIPWFSGSHEEDPETGIAD